MPKITWSTRGQLKTKIETFLTLTSGQGSHWKAMGECTPLMHIIVSLYKTLLVLFCINTILPPWLPSSPVAAFNLSTHLFATCPSGTSATGQRQALYNFIYL